MSKELLKNCILFFFFGGIYCGIEILWRGYTNWTMAIAGGISGVLIGLLNERYMSKMNILSQCVIGMVLITVLEGCVGYIVNIKLGWNVWDYSLMPGQFFYGQCCVQYSMLWFLLSGIAIFADDWIRYLLFDDPPKKYRWI